MRKLVVTLLLCLVATFVSATEIGRASWYIEKHTASGERYNRHAFTAAHRTLPLGTRVKVTNLSNGKTATVRINDRGPYKKGRIIDLSYAAALQLGMIRKGVVKVKVEK
jgi:rare lipoprotein A